MIWIGRPVVPPDRVWTNGLADGPIAKGPPRAADRARDPPKSSNERGARIEWSFLRSQEPKKLH